MGWVLVLTNERDVGADFVIRELRNRGRDVVRFNTERAAEWRVDVAPGHEWRLRGSGHEIRTRDCTGVWWRRPESPAPPELAPEVQEVVRDQWRALLRAMETAPGPVWVSRPSAIELAESKAYQLTVADKVDLKTPDTVWTNDRDSVLEILASHDQRGVVKSVATAYWESEAGASSFVFAHALDPGEVPAASAVAHCPVAVQRALMPKTDIRVTVVGDKAFSARAISGSRGVDWRLDGDVEWQEATIPGSVRHSCIELVRELGLVFAGVDLVLSGGEYWFLEANPNGEWGWLQRAGLPVAEAICDILERR